MRTGPSRHHSSTFCPEPCTVLGHVNTRQSLLDSTPDVALLSRHHVPPDSPHPTTSASPFETPARPAKRLVVIGERRATLNRRCWRRQRSPRGDACFIRLQDPDGCSPFELGKHPQLFVCCRWWHWTRLALPSNHHPNLASMVCLIFFVLLCFFPVYSFIDFQPAV